MTIKSSQHLKQLQSRKTKLVAQLPSLDLERKEAQRAYDKVNRQIQAIGAEIEALKDVEPVVTEHAILRYLERVMGLDLTAVKAEILTEKTKGLIKTLGNGKYPIGSGHTAVVKNGAVVSVV